MQMHTHLSTVGYYILASEEFNSCPVECAMNVISSQSCLQSRRKAWFVGL
jgi:hypothetical protein